MHELLAGASSERMALDDYYADFEKYFWKIKDQGFWKLERRQFFREPGYDSWVAFDNGDWDESLRILEAGRQDMARYHRRVHDHGFAARRVRVVEEPICEYLQWELHALRVRDQCGGPVRVVAGEDVAGFESTAMLPEIYTLDSHVMYEAVYDDRGVLAAALRYGDRDLIRECAHFIEDLYAVGEPLASYFTRRVAPLPPPRGSAATER